LRLSGNDPQSTDEKERTAARDEQGGRERFTVLVRDPYRAGPQHESERSEQPDAGTSSQHEGEHTSDEGEHGERSNHGERLRRTFGASEQPTEKTDRKDPRGRVENGSEQRRGADERLHEEQEDSPEEADDGSGGESRQSLT
jgi:hypothetical protein